VKQLKQNEKYSNVLKQKSFAQMPFWLRMELFRMIFAVRGCGSRRRVNMDNGDAEKIDPKIRKNGGIRLKFGSIKDVVGQFKRAEGECGQEHYSAREAVVPDDLKPKSRKNH
jgi:hypothetical protein